MTKTQLVDAYVRGEVDRRGFIAKLTAMGVSATAAAAYAASFAQSAVASPARNTAGFVARLQDADEEYGTAFIIEAIDEAITALTTALSAILETLEELFVAFTADQFVAEGLESSGLELLQTISEQVAEQMEALTAFLTTVTGSAQRQAFHSHTTSPRTQTSPKSLQMTLTNLSDEMNRLVGLVAAVGPALESGEGRQLVTNIGLVSAQHAALVADLAGLDPIPSAFAVPIDPATAQSPE